MCKQYIVPGESLVELSIKRYVTTWRRKNTLPNKRIEGAWTPDNLKRQPDWNLSSRKSPLPPRFVGSDCGE